MITEDELTRISKGPGAGFSSYNLPPKQEGYEVRVYVSHGYFSYAVGEMSSALEHAHLIMSRGVYRRSNERGEVEFHPVIKVKVLGEGLASEYPDTFKRT